MIHCKHYFNGNKISDNISLRILGLIFYGYNLVRLICRSLFALVLSKAVKCIFPRGISGFILYLCFNGRDRIDIDVHLVVGVAFESIQCFPVFAVNKERLKFICFSK